MPLKRHELVIAPLAAPAASMLFLIALITSAQLPTTFWGNNEHGSARPQTISIRYGVTRHDQGYSRPWKGGSPRRRFALRGGSVLTSCKCPKMFFVFEKRNSKFGITKFVVCFESVKLTYLKFQSLPKLRFGIINIEHVGIWQFDVLILVHCLFFWKKNKEKGNGIWNLVFVILSWD